MSTAEYRAYVEKLFRENCRVAGLWPRVFTPPGQPSVLALEAIATGGDRPLTLDGTPDGKVLGYFRANMAFDDREFEFMIQSEKPTRLDDTFNVRWASMMIVLWECVQGESGNTYRNDIVLERQEWPSNPIVLEPLPE